MSWMLALTMKFELSAGDYNANSMGNMCGIGIRKHCHMLDSKHIS